MKAVTHSSVGPSLLIALSVTITPLSSAPRTWTSSDGRTMEAEFIRATDDAVKVKMASRGEFDIPLEELSEADRKWVAETVAEANKPKPIEGKFAELITGDWALSQHGDLPFAFYAGKDFSSTKKYPLLVSLHGKSQNNENGKQIGFSKTFTSDTNFGARPCFILAPLCYQPHGATGGGWNDKPGGEVIDLVKELVKELPIDPDRIYTVGYSMGGFGVCHVLAEEPDLFAAGVAVAGYGYGENVKELKKKPLWLFHAADDSVVEIDGSRRFAEELKRNDQFKFTEFETGGHGIIGQVTGMPEMHEWLFAQRNK